MQTDRDLSIFPLFSFTITRLRKSILYVRCCFPRTRRGPSSRSTVLSYLLLIQLHDLQRCSSCSCCCPFIMRHLSGGFFFVASAAISTESDFSPQIPVSYFAYLSSRSNEISMHMSIGGILYLVNQISTGITTTTTSSSSFSSSSSSQAAMCSSNATTSKP